MGILRLTLLLFILIANPVSSGQAEPLRLILPTGNTALYRHDYPDFYQYTDRNFRGVKSHPWEGGQYGFVRNLKETREGIIFTRFHEGLDIKPLYRDRRGEPLDTIRAIDKGVVVYANTNARRSNYGKYVVVEHIWEGAPFYSLYAHMADVEVREGQRVGQGTRLGRMGYTGSGIDRRRAHVHFEINMLLNRDFSDWHRAYYRRSANPHGIYNGTNLAGIDVAALYLALRRDSDLTISEFFARQRPYFKVVMPNESPLDLLFRYPFLATRGYDDRMPAIEVSFAQSGLPIRVEPYNRRVNRTFVSMVRPSDFSYDLATNHVTGSRNDYDLSRSGTRYMNLLTTTSQWNRVLSIAAKSLPAGPFERAPVLPPTEIATAYPEWFVMTTPIQMNFRSVAPDQTNARPRAW